MCGKQTLRPAQGLSHNFTQLLMAVIFASIGPTAAAHGQVRLQQRRRQAQACSNALAPHLAPASWSTLYLWSVVHFFSPCLGNFECKY